MKRILAIFRPSNKQSLNDDHLDSENTAVDKRNTFIIVGLLFLGCALWGAAYFFTQRETTTAVPPPQFTEVVGSDFTNLDTQSATIATQTDVRKLHETINKLTKNVDSLANTLTKNRDDNAKSMKMVLDESDRRLEWARQDMEIQLTKQAEQWQTKFNNLVANNTNQDPFGLNKNAQQSSGDTQDNTTAMATPTAVAPLGIQTFSYKYPSQDVTPPYRRTSKNYVPSGSFVTAVTTGAADANAGVNGQSDTAPMTFRAIHDGVLPNGKRSRLKDCTFTASVYGEISSNRGIPRLDRMSCIFDDKTHGERILDIPVKGTAFNFGRNGIRGTPVMRNGKIMQMAGISGLFTGLGQTATNASSTSITSPSGVVSSVDPSQAFLNMGGAALENVGSKMADYYIKLAEQYHPIIELKVGAIVNLVFLEGFPLDEDKIAEYEAQLYGNEPQNVAQSIMETYTNPALALMTQQVPGGATTAPTAPINPLLNQLPPSMQAKAQQYNAQTQANPF